jgi:hypothetical protein
MGAIALKTRVAQRVASKPVLPSQAPERGRRAAAPRSMPRRSSSGRGSPGISSRASCCAGAAAASTGTRRPARRSRLASRTIHRGPPLRHARRRGRRHELDRSAGPLRLAPPAGDRRHPASRPAATLAPARPAQRPTAASSSTPPCSAGAASAPCASPAAGPIARMTSLRSSSATACSTCSGSSPILGPPGRPPAGTTILRHRPDPTPRQHLLLRHHGT